MGRGSESAPPAPSYSPSEVRYGDTVVSRTYLDPNTGTIVNQYLADPAEQAAKQQAQLKINEIVSTLGKTAPEMADQFNQSAKAFSDSAQEQFQEAYEPALRSLREDIASRFGTLNTSQFINGLDSLEKNRADALSDISMKAQIMKSDLVNDEEARKISEIQALGGVISDSQSSMLNTTKASLTAAEALNDFISGQWMQQLKSYTSDLSNKRKLTGSLLNNAISTGASIGMSFL